MRPHVPGVLVRLKLARVKFTVNPTYQAVLLHLATKKRFHLAHYSRSARRPHPRQSARHYLYQSNSELGLFVSVV